MVLITVRGCLSVMQNLDEPQYANAFFKGQVVFVYTPCDNLMCRTRNVNWMMERVVVQTVMEHRRLTDSQRPDDTTDMAFVFITRKTT
jgi:hypothetical protein